MACIVLPESEEDVALLIVFLHLLSRVGQIPLQVEMSVDLHHVSAVDVIHEIAVLPRTLKQDTKKTDLRRSSPHNLSQQGVFLDNQTLKEHPLGNPFSVRIYLRCQSQAYNCI